MPRVKKTPDITSEPEPEPEPQLEQPAAQAEEPAVVPEDTPTWTPDRDLHMGAGGSMPTPDP